MADKRMINRTIVDSDTFLDMPVSAQNLYFHLNLRADDEGFIDGPKKIARTVGAGSDDLKILLAKRYLLSFESGVVVVKHWKLHNAIRSDRIKPTLYQEEKVKLTEKPNGAYTDNLEGLADISPQNAAECPPSIEEYSIEEKSIEREKPKRFAPPTIEEIEEYAKSKGYEGFNAIKFHAHYESNGWMVGRNKMKSWQSAVVSWHSNDFTQSPQKTSPLIQKEEYHKRASALGRCLVCGKHADLKYGKCEECQDG